MPWGAETFDWNDTLTVPVSKRSESTMEFIANAEKLAAKVFRFSIRLPKRYTYKLGNPLFDHAEEVVFHCRAANIVYVNSDATFDRRRGHLVEAESHLLHVETLLGILHRVTLQLSDAGESKPPNPNVYGEFAALIEKERKLISGCKTRDTQAYKKMQQDMS